MITSNPTNRVAAIDSIGVQALEGDTSRMALKRAVLDFDVELVPVRNPRTNEVIREGDSPDAKYFATMRTDTNEVLGIVEGRYCVIPNRDIFSIADTMVEEDGARITRASSIDRGSRCFINLEWKKDRNINVLGDIVGRRAILQNAHNGKFATIIRLQPLRLACLNGMVVPVPCFSFEFRIKHTESSVDRIAEARRIMGGASKYFQTFGSIANLMAKTKVSVSLAQEVLKSIPDLSKKTPATEQKRNDILSLYNGGQANARAESMSGTAWGLLNAVSEYADHSGRIRLTQGNTSQIQRFKSSFEGSSQRLKLSAWETMMKSNDLGLRQQIAELAKSN